jgi:hypothetical protein
LLTFASTTFSLSNFTLELPAGYTGTLVETSTSLWITNLQDPPPGHDELAATAIASNPDTNGSAANPFGESAGLIPAPEPSGALLLGLGSVAILCWRRHRKGNVCPKRHIRLM